jgi:hypothetical protein
MQPAPQLREPLSQIVRDAHRGEVYAPESGRPPGGKHVTRADVAPLALAALKSIARVRSRRGRSPDRDRAFERAAGVRACVPCVRPLARSHATSQTSGRRRAANSYRGDVERVRFAGYTDSFTRAREYQIAPRFASDWALLTGHASRLGLRSPIFVPDDYAAAAGSINGAAISG